MIFALEMRLISGVHTLGVNKREREVERSVDGGREAGRERWMEKGTIEREVKRRGNQMERER